MVSDVQNSEGSVGWCEVPSVMYVSSLMFSCSIGSQIPAHKHTIDDEHSCSAVQATSQHHQLLQEPRWAQCRRDPTARCYVNLGPNQVCCHSRVHSIFIQDTLIASGAFVVEFVVVSADVDGLTCQQLGRRGLQRPSSAEYDTQHRGCDQAGHAGTVRFDEK